MFEKAWLGYSPVDSIKKYDLMFSHVYSDFEGRCISNAIEELQDAVHCMGNISMNSCLCEEKKNGVWFKQFSEGSSDSFDPGYEGYSISYRRDINTLIIEAKKEQGILYGVFDLIRRMQKGEELETISVNEKPEMPFRMIDHWDNMLGDIERGYSGNSFFYDNNEIIVNERTVYYAKLMASIGINAIAINNVNVHQVETYLITDRFLGKVKEINDIFTSYGIKLYLSVNFAAPMELGVTDVSDPFDKKVIEFWNETSKHVYDVIPDFGGYLVKADSEGRPGPFTYGRTHADGANMLARSIAPYGGNVVWRCFVYNCKQDWRDKKTDRARAAYDHFSGLDGTFEGNVVLQIKNGPMDFQVREPVSPLFGALKNTNMFLEVQIAQEYTGQQRHICYLVPMWKEILDFQTYACDNGKINEIVSGKAYGNVLCGMAAVTNTGNDENWTGHDFAAANLFGYGRLCWNTSLSAEAIGREWVTSTFGNDPFIAERVYDILADSWNTYENYTSPLGIGWMVNPSHHYGPNVEGYEYDVWGTYHRADRNGIGVDRTLAHGTGFAGQYNAPWSDNYENIATTPEELLLFFHYINYDYVLSSGKTLIQHIYDTHFEGVEEVEKMYETWNELDGKIDLKQFARVNERLSIQLESSKEWRDRINTYFYRMSGIPDKKGRTIY